MLLRLLSAVCILSFLVLPTTALAEKGVNPCDLVTKAEVEALAGEAMAAPDLQEQAMIGQRICFFSAASDDSFRFVQVTLQQLASMPEAMVKAGRTPRQNFDGIRDMLETTIPVEGVGDEAYIGTPGLHVMVGEVYLGIDVGNSDDPANQVMLKKLAAMVVPRLEAAE